MDAVVRERESSPQLRTICCGPFHELMTNVGLDSPVWRALLFFAVLWLLPLVLSGFSSDAIDFLNDGGVRAKFLIAPLLFVLVETPMQASLERAVGIFFSVPLIASQSIERAEAAVDRANVQAIAWTSEAICLVVALVASMINTFEFLDGRGPVWALSSGGLSIAGTWCLAISNTVFWFLLARLIWKHIIWSTFLFELARCDMRLVAAHPDGHGGLGFAASYPMGYWLFTVAVSSVAAAAMGHVMERQTVTPTLFAIVAACWLVIVFAYFCIPLAGLEAKIVALKSGAITAALPRITDFERRGEREALGDNVAVDVGEPSSGDLSDATPTYKAALKLSPLLINKRNLVQVAMPALMPLLVVGASFLPYSQLGPIVKRLLFL